MPNEVELLKILLKNRKIKESEKEDFINPSYENGVFDPFLMKDMEKAVVRIYEAIEANEKIIIYSDYDCDGIPSAVIINDFFNKINYKNFEIYIPNRNNEGYGLNIDAIKEFIKKEVNLLITFDLGITAAEEVLYAELNNINVIITDHHIVQDEIPKAYAILNPKQEKCKYPDKMLCGAGVAFKLIQGLVNKYGEYWKIQKGWEKWLLDMVAVATLADQVPLLNENRVFAKFGLKVLKKGKRQGLVEIFTNVKVKLSNLNEEDITFTLAPRINAASRMEDPMTAFNALAEKDPVLVKTYTDKLNNINEDRKKLVAQIIKEVKKELNKREIKNIIIIGNPKWKVGVLGIVASKIAEEHKKPVFVWGGDDEGSIKGSCRSWGSINLVEIMTSLPNGSLLEFGGHAQAGGFSVSHEEIHFLENRILEIYGEDREMEELIDGKEAEIVINIDDVNKKNYEIIKKLEPFGEGNPKPKFLIKNIGIYDLKEFGKEQNHLELSFINTKGMIIKAIAFFKTRESYNVVLSKGQRVNIIVNFEENNFLNKNEIRLRIIDIII